MTPTKKDSAARASALCKKIAALDSLASNFATTRAESESAQNAAQRLRLQLGRLVAETEPDTSLEQPEPLLQSSAPQPGGEPLRAASPTPARMWLWQLPLLALVGVLLVLFWPRSHGSAASDSDQSAQGSQVEAAPERSERERAAAAILTDIATTRGAAAAAQAQRACRIRDLLAEFKRTPGGALRSNEDSVDVRRRCSAYLSVRGLDEEACFPPAEGRPLPQCPTAE